MVVSQIFLGICRKMWTAANRDPVSSVPLAELAHAKSDVLRQKSQNRGGALPKAGCIDQIGVG
jgi:hypothetical protein